MAAISQARSVAPSDTHMPFGLQKKHPVLEAILASKSEGSGETSREKLQVMVECPHCADLYADPYILQCQHTLCHKCMLEGADGADTLRCPVCKEQCPLAEAKPDLNKQQLLAIVGEEAKQRQEQDDESDYGSDEENRVPHCEVCEKPIQWFCGECKQWMCNECKAKHVKFKATRSHKLDHIVAVAKEHRERIEKAYKEIQKAEEKLNAIVAKSDEEIRSVEYQEANALKESNAAREYWIKTINERFDEIDIKITDFVSSRVTDLQLLKSRSEVTLLELAEKSAYISGFLTLQPPIIVTRGGKLNSELDEYLGMTTIPRVEFKDSLVQFKKGVKFEPQGVGSQQLKGSHTQVNVPIQLKNVLKRADAEVTAPIPNAPKDQHKKVPLPKSKAADMRFKTEGDCDTVTHESEGISNVIAGNKENNGNGPGGPQEKQIIHRAKKGNTVKNITRDYNYGDDLGRLTPRITPAPGATSRSRLSRKTPLPNKAMTFDSLKQLLKMRYHVSAAVTLTTKPVSLRQIDGNLWCCQGDTVTIWNSDLEEVNTVKHGMLKQTQAVAQLKSGNVVIATAAGLHLLGPEGQYNGRISEECYVDVDTVDSQVFAVLFGTVTRAKMHIYDEDKPWDIQRTVVLPSDGLVTINVSCLEGMMYACSHDHGIVYVTTMNGDVVRRLGRKGVYGGAGCFNKPRICHGDMEGSVLVADKRNQCLQVHNVDGEWTVVNLVQKPDRPACAAFFNRLLFVLQTEGAWKLFKYTT